MLINIASRQLAVLHRCFSATGQQFNNHTQLCIFRNYVRDRYNCRNLFLKVQSDDELHKPPDKPFPCIDGSIAYKELRLCCCVFVINKNCSAAHSRDIFNQKFLPLDELIDQQEGILAHKVINDTYLLNDLLNHGDVGHQIQLRNSDDLRIPLYAAAQSQLFVSYRAIKMWNGLSGDLRSSSSLYTFKNKLRQLYLSLSQFPNLRSQYDY